MFAFPLGHLSMSPQSGDSQKRRDKKVITIDDYRDLAKDVIGSESLKIRPASFEIEKGTLLYTRPDVSPLAEPFSEDVDPYLQLMIPMLEIESLRQSNWGRRMKAADFRRAEDIIADLLNRLNKNPSDKKLLQEIREVDKKVKASLDSSIERYAQREGYKCVSKDVLSAVRITLKTDPPGGKICMMCELQWRILKKRGKKPEEVLANMVVTSTDVEIEGKWYYLITWPDGKKSGPSMTTVGLSDTMTLK